MNSDFNDLLRLFESYEIEYMVVGGYAVMFYVEPRYTKDLDVWIQCSTQNAEKVFAALKDFGAPLQGVAAADFSQPGMAFQIGIEPVRIDVLMSIDGLEFEPAMSRRVRASLFGQACWIISKSDLIQAKRASGRPSDLRDLESLENGEQRSSV